MFTNVLFFHKSLIIVKYISMYSENFIFSLYTFQADCISNNFVRILIFKGWIECFSLKTDDKEI